MIADQSDVEETAARGPVSRGRDLFRPVLELQAFQILLILIIILVIFSLLAPQDFPTWGNARQVLQNMSILAVMGIGMTFIIITAGIDLSIGSVLVFSGVISAITMRDLGSEGWGVAIIGGIVAVCCGTAWGVLNGVIVAKMKVPPFIVTLGTWGAALGLALVITGGNDITNVPSVLTNEVGYGNIPGTTIPILVLVATVLFVAFGILLHRTEFGLHVFAIGSSEEASRRVGVKVDKKLILVYTISGALAGFAGILSLAQFSTTAVSGQSQTNLSVISAVVIGGTSLFGGIGSLFGTAVGLSIPAVLQDGFVIVGVQPFWQQVAVGAILIVAVYIDQRRRRAAARGGEPGRGRTRGAAKTGVSNDVAHQNAELSASATI
jgi:ribose transport system permease protein